MKMLISASAFVSDPPFQNAETLQMPSANHALVHTRAYLVTTLSISPGMTPLLFGLRTSASP